MPASGMDRDAFVARIARRERAAQRNNWISRVLGRSRQKSTQAAIYDAMFESDREAVAYHYATANDHLPDLDNPVWLNEKIRWQFLNHPNPLMSLAADKLAVRDYLRLKGAVLDGPQILASGADPEALMHTPLPERYVVKSTYGSGQMHLENGEQTTARRALVSKVRRWEGRDRWRKTGEMHYRAIRKRWMVEEFIPASRRKLEYKISCTMGEPVYIGVILERDARGDVASRAVYDPDWKRLNVGSQGSAHDDRPVPRPAELDLLLAEARRLSQDFLHVRVDFLHFDDRIVFSELTFASRGARVPIEPRAANAELGAMVDLDRAPELLARGCRIASELDWQTQAA